MKQENSEGSPSPLHELSRQSQSSSPAASTDETQSESENEPSVEDQDQDQDDEDTEDGEKEIKHYSDSPPESPASIAQTTANSELVEAEDASNSSLGYWISWGFIPPVRRNPVESSPSVVRSPSAAAAAAEAGVEHGSPERKRSSAEKRQTNDDMVQNSDMVHPDHDPAQPVASPVEKSRKRSFDGGVEDKDAVMNKRRRGSHGELASRDGDGVAHQQPSGIHQLEESRRSGSLTNGSDPSANQSQAGTSAVQRKSPSNAGATPQSAGLSPSSPNTSSNVSSRAVRDWPRANPSLQVVSNFGGYTPLTMATPHRLYSEWQGE